MRGPFWNDNTGVTGEKNFKNTEPNYVTTNVGGKTVTFVGEAADAQRALQQA